MWVCAVQRDDGPVATPDQAVRPERCHQYVEVRFVMREVGGREEDDIARSVHVVERRELHVEIRADVSEATDLQFPRRVDRWRSLRTAQVIDDDAQVGNRGTKRLHLILGILGTT